MSAAEDWYQKGQTLRAAGDIGGAIKSFNQALKEKPDYADACLDLARLLDAAKQIKPAIKAYEHWLKLLQRDGITVFPISDPEFGQRLQNLLTQADSAYRARQRDKAVSLYREVLELCPGMPTAELGLAVDLHAQHRYGEAADSLLSIIKRVSGYASALNVLGSCWRHQGQHAKSIAAYHLSTTLDPQQDHIWANLLRAYMAARLYDQTFVTFEKLQQHAPQDADAHLTLAYLFANGCRWREMAQMASYVESAVQSDAFLEPFKSLYYLSVSQQLANARGWSAVRYSRKAYDAQRDLPADTRKDNKLRIGYLSSDFHTHATVVLIAELFELHDRSRFAVYAYSCGREEKSEVRNRVEKSVDYFRDVRVGDNEEIAHRIRSDQIDILVDLKGHTLDNRLDVMALRPAPIQMHYLGYPGTTGATFIDYFLTDHVASPVGSEQYFTEKLIRLPGSYQINDRHRLIPLKKSSRREYGLPEDAFVFCNMNAPYKNTPEMFAVWMRLLMQVENSVLWIHSGHEKTLPSLQQEATAAGVDPARIVFAASVPTTQHLERYLYADLCIDTFPICSHTTASDALWSGTPLVTMAGEGFVSRVAASLLTAVGLPELITHNLAEYEALALALARDPERLAKLRGHLEAGRNTFSLFDSEATTRAIEAAYLHAAELHRNKKPPQSFTLTSALEVI